ncbi:MAG: CRTAC1 family protein [Chloroflexi bacterium]|nr:CRTAC1 family protein [Chloroflexota bacterium]
MDRAARAGIHFEWTHRAKGPWTNLETFGCGCAFLDYDNDGWMDIFLVGRPRCALYHNNHDGTFTDVTAKAGITASGDWTGAAVGDYDNDGREDIYVSGYKKAMLLHNTGNGSFTDVTKKAGLQESEWGSSAIFFDADNDGRLDLLVGHYVKTGPPYPWYCHPAPKITTGCRPQSYPSEFPKLYHNNGNGTFTDVTASSGLGKAYGKSLAVQCADYDNDGKTDLYIANDGMPGDLFHNLGGGRFEDVSLEQGAAFDVAGQPQAGMGVDFGDYDRDGRLDIVVTAFSGETFSLYHNLGGVFAIASDLAGLKSTWDYLGFGVKFFDFDNDGWPDLVFVDGHVYDNASMLGDGETFRQPLLLFHNEHGRFKRVMDAGPGFSTPIVGRGMALGDIDNSGRQDLLVVDYDGRAMLLQNEAVYPSHWIGIRLQGTRSNRDGYGARVTVKTADGANVQDCSPGGSYLSSMDPRLHFGLGAAKQAREVDVRWPSGLRTALHNVHGDQYITIRETS